MNFSARAKITEVILRLPAVLGVVTIVAMSIVFAFGNERLAKSLGEVVYLSFLVVIVFAFIERFFFEKREKSKSEK
jgi:uncharacterized membrane protein YkvI